MTMVAAQGTEIKPERPKHAARQNIGAEQSNRTPAKAPNHDQSAPDKCQELTEAPTQGAEKAKRTT